MNSHTGIRKIAFIGNYLPRQCGIATFTTSLCETMAAQFPEIQCFAVPVTDTPEGYDYPERVRFEIREKDLSSYARAAEFLNINNVDVTCLQHEFGIFGGSAGGYILTLLRQLKMPVVTTLHTVLSNPSEQHLRVMEQLIAHSDRLVVMTRKASEILKTTYNISDEKIALIPHGILDIPFVDPNFYKDLFGVEGKLVLLTFGLLSPDKGIENVIKALPKIIEKHPNTVYIVLGATHPSLLRNEGESYRLSLQYLAVDLGIEKHVIFHNRFVNAEELKEFIGASDIYITPYLKKEQITSGTLSYSFGAGKAVISTPYWHAEELLADGRGALVEFNNPESIAQQVINLIDNETTRHAIRKNAYLLSREMVWSNVSNLYREAFEDSRIRRLKVQPKATLRALQAGQRELPKIKLDHLYCMSDSTGIFRHANHTVPDFSSGYASDDNAMALMLTILLEESPDAQVGRFSDLSKTYLAFLLHAFDTNKKRFRCALGFDRVWKDDGGSEDCHARSLWALGCCIGQSTNEGLQAVAGQIFEQALPPVLEFKSPRAWAMALAGTHEYSRKFEGDRLVNHTKEVLANKLLTLYKEQSTPDRNWFEASLAHCNAQLSHALIVSGKALGNQELLQAGLDSLRWLLGIQTSSKNCFHCSNVLGDQMDAIALNSFDQKPIEAYTTMIACLQAYRVTRNTWWFHEARKVFEWFLGRNEVGLSLYDPKTGGCRDALHIDRVNQNEGAEASLSFYLSLVELQTMENTLASFKEPIFA